MRELRSASLRLIVFMSILAGCGAAVPRLVFAEMAPAIVGIEAA